MHRLLYIYENLITTETYQRAVLKGEKYTVYDQQGQSQNLLASRKGGDEVDYNIFLFAGNRNGTAGEFSKIKMYHCRFFINNTIIRNFISAKNNAGTLGMYDLVEDKFYTNAGTGTFVAGAETTVGAGVDLSYGNANKTNNKISFEHNTLKLLLKNEDLGKMFGIRCKVEFYATTPSGKMLLNSSISGMTSPTSTTNGFVYDSDGWYYYKNSSGKNVVFDMSTTSSKTSKYLMQSFAIDYSSASNLFGGNSIFMEILVESVNLG